MHRASQKKYAWLAPDEDNMKIRKTLLTLGLVALSATTMAQQPNRERDPRPPVQPQNGGDRALNPQPLPPVEAPDRYRDRDHRRDNDNDRDRDHRHDRDYRHDRDHRHDRDDRDRERDFRRDRDYKNWREHDHRMNYERHRERRHELHIGKRQREILRLDWWEHPLFIRRDGPFEDYYYADGRYGVCMLRFQFGRLVEIRC